MKSWIFFFLPLCCVSCLRSTSNAQPAITTAKTNCGEHLLACGFLDYADQQELATLNEEIRTSFQIYSPENGKFAFVDAEELTEGNYDFFLPQLKNMLKKRHIDLEVKQLDENSSSPLRVSINHVEIDLCEHADLESWHYLEVAPRRFFKELNKILTAQQSNEQFYLLYGGNELATFLLTTKQFELIKTYYVDKPTEIPYLP